MTEQSQKCKDKTAQTQTLLKRRLLMCWLQC